MKIEKDIADLDKFIGGIEPEVVGFLDEKAHEALIRQKASRLLTNKRDYLNHTWNLRSGLGYVVTYNGKEKKRFIADRNHPDPRAAEATNKLLNASFVSSKGYDVIDTAELYLAQALNDKK